MNQIKPWLMARRKVTYLYFAFMIREKMGLRLRGSIIASRKKRENNQPIEEIAFWEPFLPKQADTCNPPLCASISIYSRSFWAC